MSVSLAMTWNPHGETERFRRFYPEFSQWYSGVSIVMPEDADPDALDMLATFPEIKVSSHSNWVEGRNLALESALTFDCDFVHYVDCDRLLRWFERLPMELQFTIQAANTAECLVIGR